MTRRLRSAILIALLAITGLAVSACGGAPDPVPTDTASPSPTPSESQTPTQTTPAVISAFPCTMPVPTGSAPTEAELETYRAVISSANTQPMSSHACDSVTFIISGSECCGPIPKDDALVLWGDKLGRTSDWNFSPDPTLLSEWRARSYAQYVPEGSLIGVSESGGVMTSVIFDGNIVTGLFVASLEEMLYE